MQCRASFQKGGVPITGKLYRVFNFCFAALLLVTLGLAVFLNPGSLYAFSTGKLVLCALAGLALVFCAWQGVARLPARWAVFEKRALLALFFVYAAAQLLVGWRLSVYPDASWDFGMVYTYAGDYVLHGALPDDYFLLFSNNKSLYALWCGLFSVLHFFGLRDFMWPSMVLNLVAIDISLVLLYLCARRLGGKKRALFALLFAFATAPFLLYVPIYYTDTLTLPFPIAVVYLWLGARARYKNGDVRGALARFCSLSALAAVGGILKISVLIIWVAVALDLIFLLGGRMRWALLGAGAAIVAALMALYNFAVARLPIFPAYDAAYGLPFTHWIMMGLHGYGLYYDPDYQLTLTAPDLAARYALTTAEIRRRLAEMGPLGFLRHLAQKQAFTFGDGTYWIPIKLSRTPVYQSFLHRFVIWTEPYYKYFAYGGFAVEMGMLGAGASGALGDGLRKKKALTFVRLGLLGLILFLLLWETRSRYLVNYLPLFLLCAALGVPTFVKPTARR